MSDNPFGHDDERKLEQEMLEAAEHVANVAHVERDPLLIILWRLNHQDKALGDIKCDLDQMAEILHDHIAKDSMIKDALDEMVYAWKGSKLAGKVAYWIVGIGTAIAAVLAAIKRGA
jgi:hypothetical protein